MKSLGSAVVAPVVQDVFFNIVSLAYRVASTHSSRNFLIVAGVFSAGMTSGMEIGRVDTRQWTLQSRLFEKTFSRPREMMADKDPVESTLGETVTQVAAIALNAVPMVGGVLSDIANSVIAKRQNRRLNGFLMKVADDMREFDGRVNRDFLKREEFQDLAEDVFSKAAETRQQEKLDALRNVFLNTILADRPRYDEAAEILQVIDRWHARHLILLRILTDPLAADRQMGNAVGPGGGMTTSISQILRKLLPEWDEDQIERTWDDLYKDGMHRTQGTKTMMTDRGIHQLEGRLDGFAKKVVKYISRPQYRKV